MFRSFLILLTSLWPLISVCWADELPTQVHLAAAEDNQLHQVASQILTEAYQELGIEVDIHLFPARRSMMEANEGRMDGEVARIESLESSYPNLIRVPVPVTQFEAYAFGKQEKLDITQWSDLKDLKIGILRGILYAEIGTEGMNRELFDNYEELLRLLDAGRIDVAVGSLGQTLQELKEHYPDAQIRRQGDALYRANLYHFVHKKNAAVIEPLSQILERMNQQGRSAEIYDRIFGER